MARSTGDFDTAEMEILSSLISSAQALVDRSNEGRKVIDHILSSVARVIVFYGKAGCGKTELFRRWVLPSLPGDRNVFYSPEFDFPPAVEKRGEGKSEFWSATTLPSVIVLDQFEMFFRKDVSIRSAFLRQLSDRLHKNEFRAVLVLVLPEEYLSELMTLGKDLPQILDDVSKIGSVPAEQIRITLQRLSEEHGLQIENAALKRLVDDLLKPDEGKEAISPESLAAVTFAIYRWKSLVNEQVFELADYESWGGLNGVLGNYLEYRLDALGNERGRRLAEAIVQEVVLATRAGKAPDFKEVGARFDAAKTVVDKVVRSLLDHHLEVLRSAGAGRFEVVPAQLALVIEEGIEREQQRTQQAKSLLRQAVQVFQERGVGLTELEFNRLHRQRSDLRVTKEEAELMLGCALVYEDTNLAPAVRHWFDRVKDDTAKVEILLGALFDPRARVRQRAAAFLGNLDRPEVRNQLYLVALRDSNDSVRDQAIESLNKFKDESQRQALFLEARDPNSLSPANALSALRIFPDKITADYLGKFVVESKVASFRMKAIGVLGNLRIPEALDVLLSIATQSEAGEERACAAKVLGSTHGDGLRHILERLRDEKRWLREAKASPVRVPFVVRPLIFALAGIVVFLNLFVAGLILLTLRRVRLGFGFLALEALGVVMLLSGEAYSVSGIAHGGWLVLLLAFAGNQLITTWIVLQEGEPAGVMARSYVGSVRLVLFIASALSFFLLIHGLAHALAKRVPRGAQLFAYGFAGLVFLVFSFLFIKTHAHLSVFYFIIGLALFLYSYFADVAKVLFDSVLFRTKDELRRRVEVVHREVMKNPEACETLLRSLQASETKETRWASRMLRRFPVGSQTLVAPFRQLWGGADTIARRRMASVLAAHRTEESVNTLRELTREMGWRGGLTYLWFGLRYGVLPRPFLRISVLSLLVLVGSLSIFEAKFGVPIASLRRERTVRDSSRQIKDREKAAEELAKVEPKMAFDSVSQVLGSPKESIKVKKSMLPSLTEIIKTTSYNYPRQALKLLAEQATRRGPLELRLAALQQLEDVAKVSQVEWLRDRSILAIDKLLENTQEDPTLRATALHCLEKIGTQRASDRLRDFANQRRVHIGTKIQQVGKSSRTVRGDKENSLREEAKRALGQIELRQERHRLESSYYGLIWQHPSPQLWDKIIKDLKDGRDLSNEGCDALAIAYYQKYALPVRGAKSQVQEAVAKLEPLLRRCPGSIQAGSLLAALYHDSLGPADASFFDKAYKVLNKVPLTNTQEDLSIPIQANLAEACLTNGRYDQARSLGEKILRSKVMAERKDLGLNVRFLIFASLVFQRDKKGSDRQRKELLRFYKSLPGNFENDWDFRGTRSYVRQSTLPADQKDLLLSTLDLITGTRRNKDRKIGRKD